MLIDCDSCVVRGLACGDCVVTVLLGAPPAGVVLDDDERRALEVLAGSGLVPPRLAIFGLVGGPLIIITGTLAMFDVIEKGGSVMGLATAPEFIWELVLGIYPIVWGFRASSPILAASRDASV